jgi:EAL domain-containing protein (putative c-di-GMP-specific phosphodiesterase class I)
MDDPQRLINRTNEGPWWIDLTTEQFETSSSLANEARAAGYTALAMLPIRWQGRIDGLLALGTLDRSGPLLMEARLPALVEVSSFAGTLFGSQAEIFGHQESIQAEIRDVVEHQRFHPVFQPVVNVNTGAIVGYEGLTRFDDGRQPDLRFVEASSVGLGMELEVACARAAIEAADAEGGLAGDAWLSVNFSPKVVISGEAATLAKTTARKLAIEVTEHAHIDDYEKLRAAIGEITGCNLFVDDAGAGYAGLRHILELHPDLIKLDIALVRGVDSDPARQALVSGMRHFANQTGTLLLAEGVETPEEAKTLASLGVDFAQGYLYGRPEPITD